MIIDLPNRFQFTGIQDEFAKVTDSIMHIHGNTSFKKLMYATTFALKGNTICYYCHKPVSEKHITLDHMYPQFVGGPTITNNLVPCCDKCNSRKGNLSEAQFYVYMSLRKEDREFYRRSCYEQQLIVKKGQGNELPEECVTYSSTNEFLVKVDLNKKFRGSKYSRINAYYKQYHSIQKPIVVDSNGFVLDGYVSLMFAKEQGIKVLPSIILENVVSHL